jgi:hypothetical protein
MSSHNSKIDLINRNLVAYRPKLARFKSPPKWDSTPVELPTDFSPQGYLFSNPDVALAGYDPSLHYIRFGYRENRKW